MPWDLSTGLEEKAMETWLLVIVESLEDNDINFQEMEPKVLAMCCICC